MGRRESEKMMERTLLLVDDEENIVSSLTRLLRRDGYRILQAGSGEQGLELLAQNEVGVIISDQRMPKMSGTEFLSQAKHLYPDAMRIMLSGYTALDSVAEAINRGSIYKFLTKPWDEELLRTSVSEAFLQYEMKMENARLFSKSRKANEQLLRINQELARLVVEKNSNITHSMNLLKVSQEILEHLPVAVIGIKKDGMITVANRMAHRLFATDGRILTCEMAYGIIPAELLGLRPSRDDGKELCLADGRKLNCWCNTTGELSQANGMILSCIIVPSNKQQS